MRCTYIPVTCTFICLTFLFYFYNTRSFIECNPIASVDVLCINAEVVGWITPATPSTISPVLNPTIVL